MTEEAKKKRHELAELFKEKNLNIVWWQPTLVIKTSYEAGFDAAYELMEAENAELKEIISELSDSMAAISDLSSHMKFAAILFANKGKTISLPKTARTALVKDDLNE